MPKWVTESMLGAAAEMVRVSEVVRASENVGRPQRLWGGNKGNMGICNSWVAARRERCPAVNGLIFVNPYVSQPVRQFTLGVSEALRPEWL